MRTFTYGLTYKEKISTLESGECRQTIRLHNPNANQQKRPGDRFVLHTWAGMPYRTKWDWRAEYAITDVPQIIVTKEGVWQLPGSPVVPSTGEDCLHMRLLTKAELDLLAKLDGIVPPTGEELIAVLVNVNTKDVMGLILDVIRFEKQ
jgi:hypothetical protein